MENFTETFGKFQSYFKNLQTNGHVTWKLEYVYLPSSSMPQWVFVGLSKLK